jgi:2-isopropylmalate synthase
MTQIFLYDTTLRDGTQGEDVTFSVDDKLKIARRLDDFGIHYIEGGWPGSNPRDMEFFRRAKSIKLRHARIAAFGSTRRANRSAEDDENLNTLLEADTPVITIFGKSWLLHVHSALKVSDDENLTMIGDSVGYLKSKGREVIYDAEHFFDGFKHDREYALSTLRGAERAGADCIVLCDTNGGTLTSEVVEIIRIVKDTVSLPVGIHAHNDGELAVANSVAAIQNGAVHVQGTINGYGERCGNANLCSIIPNIQVKLGYRCIADESLRQLTGVSQYVSELANLPHNKSLPYVGASSFAHKGGVHVSAVMKDPSTYEHMTPETVGNVRRVLVSDLSGKSNVLWKLEEMGNGKEIAAQDVQNLVKDIKEKEYAGYCYENADGSFALLVRRRQEGWKDYFELSGFKVIIHKESGGSEPVSEALIKVRVGDTVEYAAAEGNGPVNALDNALRKALGKFYPQLGDIYLSDYKVRVIDEQDGTGAKVRVLITTRNGGDSWNTVGVSTNIIDASYEALVDSIYYYLMKTEKLEEKSATLAE